MTSRLRRPVLLLAVAAALAGACSSGGEGTADTAETASPTTVAPTTAAPTTAAPTTAAPTTAAPTTAAPATTAAPTTVAVDVGVFPDEEWAIGELPDGVDRAVLDAAVDAAFGAPDALARVRSVVVVHGGEIVYERYHPLDSAETVMESYSVAKSFTSALVGLLVGDGLLEVDERAPVAAWSDPADPRHAITLEHLLHMASGLEWTEEYGPGSKAAEMFVAEVASDVPAAVELEAVPGEQFEYSTGTTAILAGIVTDTLGGVEATDDFIEERLLDPIGITSTEFQRDGSGRWFGGFGANSTTRDFARFGLLYLNDGVWAGERVLPEGWVDYSREPSPANPAYGAQWWMLHEDSFEARGLFGQIVLVSQPHDLVIAINTTQGGDADTLVGALYDELRGA